MNLLESHPDIAKQWHPTKNGDLKPEQFTKGSGKKIWWLCDKKCNYGCNHEWIAVISTQIKGCRCPYCSLPCKKLCIHNSIVYLYPQIAAQWHPTKNGDLKPEYFTTGSSIKVWWLCENTCKEGCKHEWECNIANRTINNRGCPYCVNQKICIHESIVYTHPAIAIQWHPHKNSDLKPEQFSFGSNKKIWWLCEIICKERCKHEWETTVASRISGFGCPYCSIPKQKICIHDSIVYTHSEIAKQWHPTKNGDLKPEQFSYGSSHKNIWWLCNNTCKEGCIHIWKSSINNRIRGDDCSYCSKHIICIHDSIVYTHSEIAKQWHPTKNGELKPELLSSGSGLKVWWLCENTCKYNCKHEWEIRIVNRTNGNGCPYCSIPKQKICIHTSIVYTHPEIEKQWHPTKNGILKADEYSHGSGEKVWWINSICNHEWKAQIVNRTGRLDGCPYCINKTETKLYDTLIQYYLELQRQFKIEWCKNKSYLPFDFVLEEDKIIIELDGIQHFEQISNWASPVETYKTDKYKMKCANDNGFSIIRLLQTDVYYDTYNWLEELQINIEKIKTDNIVQNLYMCKDNEYDIFQTLQISLE